MIEAYLRPAYQKFLVNPVAWQINMRTRWSPNAVTVVAIICGLLSALLIVLQQPLLASFLLLLSGYFDTLDGTLARLKQHSTSQGAVLDIVGDRVVEFVIILALYCVAPITRGMPALWMLGTTLLCVSSFLVVGIFANNDSSKSFHYSVGIMERAEAFAFFIAMIIMPSWFVPLAWLYSTLVLMTAVIRVSQFIKHESV